MVLCLLLFFGGQFRLVNYFDSEIVRSLSAYFGKTRGEMGYSAGYLCPSFSQMQKACSHDESHIILCS